VTCNAKRDVLIFLATYPTRTRIQLATELDALLSNLVPFTLLSRSVPCSSEPVYNTC